MLCIYDLIVLLIRVLKREIIFYVIFYFKQTYILFTFFSCRLFWFLYFDNIVY